jgi:hypothetical protein
MSTIIQQEIRNEDRLVAELYQLGVTYLSNRATGEGEQPRSPGQILADTVCQPSARVRTSVIALLLLHPSYAAEIPLSLYLLKKEYGSLALKLFYTAAFYLQRAYYKELLPIVGSNWEWLPDLFSQELGVSSDFSPQDSIRLLGMKHQELTHSLTNWSGTYENVVQHLIRYKRRELQWNQSLPKPSLNS